VDWGPEHEIGATTIGKVEEGKDKEVMGKGKGKDKEVTGKGKGRGSKLPPPPPPAGPRPVGIQEPPPPPPRPQLSPVGPLGLETAAAAADTSRGSSGPGGGGGGGGSWAAAMDVDEEQVLKEEGDFAGASGAACTEQAAHQCVRCNRKFALYTWMIYCLPGTGVVAEVQDSTITRSMDGGVFKNLYMERAVELICVYCFHQANRTAIPSQYMRSESGPVTSAWVKLARRSKSLQTDRKKAEWILNRLEKVKAEKGEPCNAKMVWESLTKSQDLNKGTDWVTRLGECVTLHYGCEGCNIYPLKSSGWYRLIKSTVNTDQVGLSVDSCGHWACGACCARWSWGTGGARRLMIINGPDEPLYLFVGELNSLQENTVKFLKAAQMLQKIGNAAINKDTVLKTIMQLNDEVQQKLLHLKEVRSFTSINPATHDRAWQFKVYCEHEALSLRGPGRQFFALDLKERVEGPPPTASAMEIDLILDIVAATMNFEAVAVGTASEKATYWRLAGNSRIPQFRELMSRM
jgi:hypothetical protein